MISWSVTLAEFADMLNHPSKCAVQWKSSYHADPCGFVTSPTPRQSTSSCVFFDTVRLAFFDATLKGNRATPLMVLPRARARACLTHANRATRTRQSRSQDRACSRVDGVFCRAAGFSSLDSLSPKASRAREGFPSSPLARDRFDEGLLLIGRVSVVRNGWLGSKRPSIRSYRV